MPDYQGRRTAAGHAGHGVDRQTSKALRKYAANTDQGQHAVKRDWLKLSHKERGSMRKAMGLKKASSFGRRDAFHGVTWGAVWHYDTEAGGGK